jgi:hypothetical protein
MRKVDENAGDVLGHMPIVNARRSYQMLLRLIRQVPA